MENIPPAPRGMGIRVNGDGSFAVIPNAGFKIGDVVLNEDTGKKMRIVTERIRLGDLSTGRFQFSHNGHWYSAKVHGRETMYCPVQPPNMPLGRESIEKIEFGMFPETIVDALDFEEVVD